MFWCPYGIDPDTAPSEPQAEFHAAAFEHTYTYMVGGLASGKSWAGSWQFLFNIFENREAMQEAGRDGELTYLVGAPSYQLIDAAPWRHILAILDEMASINGFSLIKGKPLKTHPREIRLISGDTIKFIATDAGRFAGMNAAGVWFDEAEEADDPEGGFHLLDNRLRDRRSPRLFYIVTSTPGIAGMGVARIFKERIASEDPKYAMVHAKTETNPAYADGDYVERRRATMSRREARVKLDGEILPPEGAVYALEFDDLESLAQGWKLDPEKTGRREWNLMIDWGGSYHALLSEYNPATDTDVVFAEFIRDGIQPEKFCGELVEYLKRHLGIHPDDIDNVVVDYNPKDARIESYKWWRGKVSHRRVKNNDDRKRRINTLRWRLQDAKGRRRFLFAPTLRVTKSNRPVLRCFTNYKWVERRIQGDDVYLDRPIQESLWSHACNAAEYYCDIRYSHMRVHLREVA